MPIGSVVIGKGIGQRIGALFERKTKEKKSNEEAKEK
jgi:hypothetical protein